MRFQQEATVLRVVGLDALGREVRLAPEAGDAWLAMQKAAEADQIQLLLISGFRSFVRQTEILKKKLEKGGVLSEILKVSAYPGYSEHHTGRAVDIGASHCQHLTEDFENTPEFKWLATQAASFGFTLSYPRENKHGIAFEPWHWCFNGVAQTKVSSPFLYIFSGLPGSGKSTLAQRVAAKLSCVYLRIDTIEQALRELCSITVEAEGYELSYKITADNLKLGISVVADSCNSIELTRNAWEEIARSNGATPINVEICCTDKLEHQRRVETRISSVAGLRLPTWLDVEQREYDAWTKERIIVDTSGRTIDESFDQLCEALMNQQEIHNSGAR